MNDPVLATIVTWLYKDQWVFQFNYSLPISSERYLSGFYFTFVFLLELFNYLCFISGLSTSSENQYMFFGPTVKHIFLVF